ncbi:MAG: PAS domain-containing sensor histidine kinase [Acidobacteria bacterium]|nr:PAS domain-containing sensor histidine kinase [Acidobacteriota bacterium]
MICRILRAGASVGIITAILAFCHSLAHVTGVTTALALVLAVLVMAAKWGFLEAVAGSLAGGLGLDYFFPIPYGPGIEELQYWLVQLMFLATAIMGGRLSRHAKRTAEEAERRCVGMEKTRASRIEEAGQAEAARRSEELKSAVIDALTHEFKTPLTSIKAAITCLISGNAHDTAPDVTELFSVIDEEADRMQKLLGQAVDRARLQATDLSLDKRPQDMTDTIYGILEEFHSAFESRPMQVQIPAVFPLVHCDASLIKQVLKQLLENALKYSPPGSPVTISCERQHHTVVVHVTDSGVGVPEEEQSEIFNQYYRGRLGAGRAPGTGMGLAIARRIVELHGGRIWVTSRPGAGSVFHFSLPVWINEGAVTGPKGAAA